MADTPDNCKIEKCTFNCNETCIKIYGSSAVTGNIITQNILENNTTGAETPIIYLYYNTGTEVTKNRLIQGDSGNGIRIHGHNTGLKINNNYLSNTNSSPSIVPCSIHIESSGQSADIYFNTFSTKRSWGIHGNASNTFTSVNFKNNILVAYKNGTESDNSAIYCSGSSSFASCDYNCYYVDAGSYLASKNSTNYWDLTEWKATGYDTHSISVDPKFEDAANNDLDLLATSLAFGKGVSLGSISDDIKGYSRPASPAIGAFDANSPLPVELISFKARCKSEGVELTWTTASELNNNFFEIQRSSDMQNWQTINEVKGSGNSNALLSYLYFDNTNVSETFYYQLKQVDFDGKFVFSEKIYTDCNDESKFKVMNIFPNPSSGKYEVEMFFPAKSSFIISVFDYKGCMINKEIVGDAEGTYLYKIDLSDYKDGLYMVQIADENTCYYNKLIKH
ncbi:MAG: T9SS type A sorting domain-containing protein [Bacteroidota bacterium]